MCHEPGSIAPVLGAGSPPRDQQDLTLRGDDGNVFNGFLAEPVAPNGQAVVILPDVRGLHDYYRQLAVSFAGAGIRALAIDYFGRTAGLGQRPDDFEWLPHVRALTPEGVASDVAAAVDFLRRDGASEVADVFTVGFCLGGGHSWRQAAVNPDISGAVGFYGRPQLAEDVVDRMRAPLLLLVAGKDEHIPREESERFHQRLLAAGARSDMVVYDNAPHSFFDHAFDEFSAECEDAGSRVLRFMADNASHSTASA